MIYGSIALLCLAGALILLAALSWVDLKTRLLPNVMVAPFAILGIVFHGVTLFQYLSPFAVIAGGVAGYGIMYAIRAVANHMYKTDALGLGDVKLLGAAGLWLGPDAVMLAMSAGAFAGALHGVVHALWQARKTGTRPAFARLQIPAGPGFAVGIAAVAVYQFWDFRPF
jgi:leader peptidase (prepilin peptidase)/N-methyltransferase